MSGIRKELISENLRFFEKPQKAWMQTHKVSWLAGPHKQKN